MTDEGSRGNSASAVFRSAEPPSLSARVVAVSSGTAGILRAIRSRRACRCGGFEVISCGGRHSAHVPQRSIAAGWQSAPWRQSSGLRLQTATSHKQRACIHDTRRPRRPSVRWPHQPSNRVWFASRRLSRRRLVYAVQSGWPFLRPFCIYRRGQVLQLQHAYVSACRITGANEICAKTRSANVAWLLPVPVAF